MPGGKQAVYCGAERAAGACAARDAGTAMRPTGRSDGFWTIAMAISVGLSVAIMVLAASHDSQGIWGDTTAAWLQAVGSILAILAGIAMANSASRQASADARLEKLEGARAAISLAHKTLELVADRLRVACDPLTEASHGMALRQGEERTRYSRS